MVGGDWSFNHDGLGFRCSSSSRISVQIYQNTQLEYFGAALEWSQAGDCRNHAGMGKKHDLERDTALSKTVCQKGISLSKAAMEVIEARLEGNPILLK